MRVRCRRCARLTTTRYACKVCGSVAHQIHCHNREHMNHTHSWSGPARAVGYDGIDMGVCPAFTLAGLHLHPYNFATSGTPDEDHRNAPCHYACTDQAPPIPGWTGR